MLSQAEKQYFAQEQARHEASYLAGATPQEQSGFQRDAQAWKRFRRLIVEPIHKAGTFLDIGCANGLLMEDVANWTREDGHGVDVYGLDISEALAELARRQFPHLSRRVFVGNALLWDPPNRFDFVRTELVYVPAPLRRRYVERLLSRFVASDGKLIVCSYGSSRPEGSRAALLVDEIQSWGLVVSDIHDARSREHGLVVTRVVTLEAGKQLDQAIRPEGGHAAAADRPNR